MMEVAIWIWVSLPIILLAVIVNMWVKWGEDRAKLSNALVRTSNAELDAARLGQCYHELDDEYRKLYADFHRVLYQNRTLKGNITKLKKRLGDDE